MWTDQLKSSFETRIRNNQIQVHVCPLCGNDKWNLEFSISKGLWHCWACGLGGKVEKFFKQQNLPFDKDQWQSSSATQSKKQEEKINLSSFVVFDGSKHGKFSKSRGLTSEDEKLYGLKLGTEGKYKDKVVVPLYEGSNLVSFVARDMASGMYMNPSIEKSRILPYYLGTKNKYTVYLCEGVFDSIAVHKLGFSSATLLGTILSLQQIRKIKDFGFKEVVVCLDGDAKSKAIKMYDLAERNNLQVKIVFFDKKDDPNSLFLKDAKELERKLSNPEVLTLVQRVQK